MNINRILRYIFFVFTGLLIVTFFSCKEKTEDTIKIGILNGPSAVSFIQLVDKQVYVDDKKVEIIIKSEPLQIQALMMKKEVDFAILPTVMAANLYNKGLKYKVVACPIWGTLYLLTNDPAISKNNLGNQKISVFGRASTADVLLRRYLKERNINDEYIDYTHSTNHEVAQALQSKSIKLGVVSEPLVSNLLAQDSQIKIIDKLDCEEYIDNQSRDIFVQTSFVVSSKFIESYPNLINKVCELYSKSCNFVNEQTQEAAKLMVKHKISPSTEVAKASIPLCNIQYVGAFALEKEITKYLNIFYEFNPQSIGGKLPDKDFIFQTY